MNHFSEEHEDYPSNQACGELVTCFKCIENQHVILIIIIKLIEPDSRSANKLALRCPDLTRKKFFRIRDSFDPVSHQLLSVETPRIHDQSGLMLVYQLLRIIGLKKASRMQVLRQ